MIVIRHTIYRDDTNTKVDWFTEIPFNIIFTCTVGKYNMKRRYRNALMTTPPAHTLTRLTPVTHSPSATLLFLLLHAP
jgi:hypothetical protein